MYILDCYMLILRIYISMFFIFYFANKNIPNLESFINDHISLDKPTTIVVFHELGDEDFRLHVNVEDHSIIVFFSKLFS